MARNADPNAPIVRFFLNQPLALAQQALSTIKTLVAERVRSEAPPAAAPKRRRARKPKAVMQEGTAPGTPETATAPAVPITTVPGPVAVPTPTPRRRRPPTAITAPGATVTPANPTGAMPALGTGTTTGQG